MKLVDLLVQELPKRCGWPEGALNATQDKDGEVCFSSGATPEFGYAAWEGGDWCGNEFHTIRASDYDTAIITRDQYEAALAASKAVVGHNGWIQWAGGECPVDSDAIVDVKYRNPNPYQYNNDRAGDFAWAHDGIDGDIIAYRLHDQDINHRTNDDRLEQDLNECIGQGVNVPEWNGDGLPPVGTICEAKVPRSITGWEWRKVKVVEPGIPGAEKEVLVYDLETTLPAWTDEFRPLRTEAEKAREKLAASLHIAAGASPIELNGIGRLYFKLADAIISGSVFGTTFKAGK